MNKPLKIIWAARTWKQALLSKMNPECSLERLMLKLKLQYFLQLRRTTNSLENTWCQEALRPGVEGIRGWGGWIATLMQLTWTWANSRRCWGTGKPNVPLSMGSKRIWCDCTTLTVNYKNVIPIHLYLLFCFVYLFVSVCVAFSHEQNLYFFLFKNF